MPSASKGRDRHHRRARARSEALAAGLAQDISTRAESPSRSQDQAVASFTDAIDDVVRHADAVHHATDRAAHELLRAKQEREAGVPLVDVISGLVARGGRTTRLAASEAFLEFEQSLMAYRATAIRGLVDEEQMTFTEIARLIGVSRQMVARLYRTAEPDTSPCGEHPGLT